MGDAHAHSLSEHGRPHARVGGHKGQSDQDPVGHTEVTDRAAIAHHAELLESVHSGCPQWLSTLDRRGPPARQHPDRIRRREASLDDLSPGLRGKVSRLFG
jgi:hypothetical protein